MLSTCPSLLWRETAARYKVWCTEEVPELWLDACRCILRMYTQLISTWAVLNRENYFLFVCLFFLIVLLQWAIIAVTHSYDMLLELPEGLFFSNKKQWNGRSPAANMPIICCAHMADPLDFLGPVPNPGVEGAPFKYSLFLLLFPEVLACSHCA